MLTMVEHQVFLLNREYCKGNVIVVIVCIFSALLMLLLLVIQFVILLSSVISFLWVDESNGQYLY